MENVFLLGNFIEEVLVRMQDRDAQEIEEITAALLDENPAWDCLELTVPLNGQVEEEIFNALVSSEKITSLGITPVVETGCIEDMLGKAIPVLPNLRRVDIALSLSETQAERILPMLRATPTLSQIELFLGNCAEGIAEPFATFLRESTSLRALILSFTKYGERRYVDVPQASLSRICDGITESKSLQRLFFCGLPGDDDDNGNILAKALAPAIATCASLMVVTFPRSPYFAARLTNGLLQHDAVKTLTCVFLRPRPRQEVLITRLC